MSRLNRPVQPEIIFPYRFEQYILPFITMTCTFDTHTLMDERIRILSAVE